VEKGVLSPENRAKQLEMYQGTDTAFELANKYNMKIAFPILAIGIGKFYPRFPVNNLFLVPPFETPVSFFI